MSDDDVKPTDSDEPSDDYLLDELLGDDPLDDDRSMRWTMLWRTELLTEGSRKNREENEPTRTEDRASDSTARHS